VNDTKPESHLLTIDRRILTGSEITLLAAFARIVKARRKGTSAYYEEDNKLKRSPYREAMVALHQIYHASRDWKDNRERTLEQASGRCEECGAVSTTAHHTTYENWALGEEELQDLKAVCRHCHASAHRRNEVDVPFFARRNADHVTSFLPSKIRDEIASMCFLEDGPL